MIVRSRFSATVAPVILLLLSLVATTTTTGIVEATSGVEFASKTLWRNRRQNQSNCSSSTALRLDVWDTNSQSVIRPNLQSGARLCSTREQQPFDAILYTIEAVVVAVTTITQTPCRITSVRFALQGPNNSRHVQTERSSKFILFGGNAIASSIGRSLPEGSYTLTVTTNLSSQPLTISFTVDSCRPDAPTSSTRVLAFPSVQGHGAFSRGGRGGRILKVTSLLDNENSDDEVGTLRWALMQTGPRIIMFDVAGTIVLQRSIVLDGPQYSYLTLAGQSAPGDGGIQIKGYELNLSNVHDVIIRYMRFRPGFTKPDEHAKFSLMISGTTADKSRLGSYNIVVDHCTFSWASDDTGLWDHVHSVTWSHNIMGEAMLHDYNVSGNKPISRGMIVGAEDGTGSANQYNISIYRNYFCSNDQRNAYFSAVGPYEFINNVIYNWGSFGTALRSRSGSLKINLIGNVYKEGPALKTAGRYAIGIDEEFPNEQIYLYDNVDSRYRTNSSQADWDIIGTGNLPAEQLATLYWRVNAPVRHQRTTPWPAAITAVDILPSSTVVDSVLSSVGATRPMRDAHDVKMVQDYRANTGVIKLASTQRATDWPVLTSSALPLIDSDGDGMPNAYEVQFGLDPNNGADGGWDLDGDGYTNVEEYLNLSDPTRPDQ